MQHVIVENRAQAEVAQKINQAACEIAKLLDGIADLAAKAKTAQAGAFSVAQDVRILAGDASKLAVAQAEFDSLVRVSSAVGLSQALVVQAATPVQSWFHTEA